jgi:hypothetical protein
VIERNPVHRSGLQGVHGDARPHGGGVFRGRREKAQGDRRVEIGPVAEPGAVFLDEVEPVLGKHPPGLIVVGAEQVARPRDAYRGVLAERFARLHDVYGLVLGVF